VNFNGYTLGGNSTLTLNVVGGVPAINVLPGQPHDRRAGLADQRRAVNVVSGSKLTFGKNVLGVGSPGLILAEAGGSNWRRAGQRSSRPARSASPARARSSTSSSHTGSSPQPTTPSAR
jgi:hypothetical protein